jgi:nucleoside-diphosphate-sugar epimerase
VHRAVVTGAGGSTGNRLVAALKREGFWVRGVDSRFPALEASVADEYLLADLTGWRSCLAVTRGVDVVFALARTTASDAARRWFDDTILSLNTAMAASENGVGRVVVTGGGLARELARRLPGCVVCPHELDALVAAALDVSPVRA